MGTFAIPRQMDIIPPGSKMAPKARTIIQYAERGKPYVLTADESAYITRNNLEFLRDWSSPEEAGLNMEQQ